MELVSLPRLRRKLIPTKYFTYSEKEVKEKKI